MSFEIVRLLSNPTNSTTVRPTINDPAEFIADLPITIAKVGTRWRVNMESLMFRPVFSNVRYLEPYGPHLIAWECKNFTKSDICQNYDPTKPETFPKKSVIECRYSVREATLDLRKRYGDMKLFARMLNQLLDWSLKRDTDEPAAKKKKKKMSTPTTPTKTTAATTTTTTGTTMMEKTTDASSNKIEFSVGQTGSLLIEGNGEVVLLVSSRFSDWIGLTDDFGPIIHFGSHQNPHYRFLDFSNGLASDENGWWYAEGNVANMLASSRVEPSRIHVMVSFSNGQGRESTLGIMPYDSKTVCSCDSTEQYFHRSLEGKEPVAVGHNEDLRQVKIRLIDQHGRTLRLINNLEHPTIVTLAFNEILTDMPDIRETFIIKSPFKELTYQFDPPLDNSTGTWQAGLRRVYIPRNIDWVDENDLDYEIRIDAHGVEKPIHLDPPPAKAFRTSESLVTYLAAALKNGTSGKVELKTVASAAAGCVSHDRVRIILPQDGVTTVRMWRKFAAVLGLDNVESHDDLVIIDATTEGNRCVDVRRVFPACIAIHCDIIKPSLFGAAPKDVLEIVPIGTKCGMEGEWIVYQTRKPFYWDVRGSHISSYSITLRSILHGREIKFQRDVGNEEQLLIQVSLRDKRR